MAKLEFKVAADYKEVDKLTDSVNRLENQVKGLKSSDLGLDSWITQFDKFQRELKAKASEIEMLKARILSFDNMQDRKGLDYLGQQLETAKNQYYQLAQEAADGANRFQASFNKASSALLASQKNVDSVTWKLIEQKEVVANLQSEVRRLNEAYRAAGKDEKGAISAQLTSKKQQLEDERVSLNNLRAEQERAKLAVKSLRDEVASYEKTTRSVTGAQNENEISLKKMLAAFGGAVAIKSFVSDMVRVRGEFQKTQMAFETMLGSKEKADMLMSQMIQTAAKTPFDLQGVADGAKQLLAYGTQAKDVNDTLVRLGNIASGLNIPLGEMVYLYGTTQTQGRLFTQDVRQFMGRGIPLVKEMASLLGKTEEEINKMVTAGQIGFPQVRQVIEKMTNEGGQFYNLMEKQSQTLSGQISNLGDAWDQMLNSIGEETQGVASSTISMATNVVENYEEVGKSIIAIASTYGTYRAALAITAIAQDTLTARMQFALIVTKAQTMAQGALNTIMKANPYVLLATAIVGIIGALWALYDGTTAAEKAQKQLNEEHEEAVQRKEELASKTEGLTSKINSETESVYAQIKAYKELIKLFPELGNMSFEEFKNLPQDQQKKILSRINEDREITDTVKAYEDDLKRIEYLKKVINATITLPNSGYALNKLNEELDKANHLANLHKKEIEEIKQNQWEANTPIEEKIKHYQDIQARLEKERDELNSQLNPSKVLKSYTGEMADSWLNAKNTIANIKLDALNQQIEETGEKIDSLTGKNASAVKNKSYWEKQKKEAETALEEIDSKQKKLMDAGNFKGIDAEIVKKYKEQSKLFKEAEVELGAYGSSSKQESEASKRLKAQQELSRSILESELRLQADRIAIMQDGKDKRILLADHEYRETLSVIAKARAEYQKKVKEAGQTEDPAVMATFDSRESAAKSKRDTDVASINKEYFDDYAKRTKALTDVFLSEEKKRLSAVKERYEEERKWADEQLKTGGMSEEQYQTYVINVDKAEAEESLRSLLDKYQDYTTERKRIEEQFQEEIETLEKGRTQNNAASVDAAIAEARKKEKEALSNLDLDNLQKEIDWSTVFGDLEKVSTSTLKRLQEQLRNYLSDVGDTISKEDLKVVTDALTQIGEVQADRRPIDELKTAYESYTQACRKVAAAQQKVNELEAKGDKTSEEYKKAVKGLTAAQDERRSSLVSMTQAVNSMGQKGGELVQAGGDIVGMLTDLGVKVPEAVGKTLDGVGQIFSGLASIDLTKPFSIVTGLIDMIGGLGKTIGGIFGFMGADYSGYDKLKERYEGLLDVWDDLIARKKEYLSISTGEEAKRTEEEALALVQKQIDTTKILAKERLNAGKGAGSHSMWYRMWKGSYKFDGMNWQDVAGDIESHLGVPFKGMDDMLNMTADQLLWIKENYSGLWMAMDGDYRKYLEQLIEYGDSAKDIVKQTSESLTQVSFDSVYDSFLSTLMDMDSSAEDFAEDFEGYMQKAILNTMLADKYKEKLQKWYKAFAKSNEDGNIDSDEYKQLKQEWDNMVSDAISDRENLKKMFAWGSDEKEEPSDNTLKGAFAKASQESIDLLAGQAGAQRAAIEAIREMFRFIYELQKQGWQDVRIIRDLTTKVDKNTELVAENTREIRAIAEKISEHTKQTVETLDNIDNRGIKVKM